MRTRSNSGVRLDYYKDMLFSTVLCNQHPVTGLLPASKGSQHSWVRDNVYCAVSLWALSMAYKKHSDLDEERSKTYEMEQRVVKIMRGLLLSMMYQKDKVELFKKSQSTKDALHAKYNTNTGQTCIGDDEWGHLQIDATSLYLLILAQMTASGLQLIYSLDEVAFVQNLVFYIESAYFTPDYGIWERGDKTNHGLPELNASSIGMAKAAMEAMNDLDLFGAHGGPASVIHILPDEVQKCQAVLESMLPRESISKELDSGLLSITSFPAFAVGDVDIIDRTREAVLSKLLGKYGCKRFLRDGYMTCKEDRNRLYYEPWELRMFENIECEWPLFFCFLAIDRCYAGDLAAMDENLQKLEAVMVRTEDGQKLAPEMYQIPAASLEAELAAPGSQARVPVGRAPFFWAQSLYVIGKLLQEGCVQPAELDPLNRRLGSEKKPDVVVQVAILAENKLVQQIMAEKHDFHTQTVDEVYPIEVQPARVLGKLFTHLGMNKKLALSGRATLDVGSLGTSILYSLQGQVFAFTPQFLDMDRFFFASDAQLVIDILMNEINFLQSSWTNMMGRPLVTIVFHEDLLEDGRVPAPYVQTFRKIKTGYLNGTRVALGPIKDFVNTSCLSSLEFLNDHEAGRSDSLKPEVRQYLDHHLRKALALRRSTLDSLRPGLRPSGAAAAAPARRQSVRGAIRRTRSIFGDEPLVAARASVQDSAFCLTRRRSVRRTSGEEEAPLGPVPEDAPAPRTRVNSDETRDPLDSFHGVRTESDVHYDAVSSEELLALLRDTTDLEERGDILHYLAVANGLGFALELDGRRLTVRELYDDLYEKACRQKHWAIVRHTAGMLGKRITDLAEAVTAMLVRQKQLTVGAPPDEVAIVVPLPAGELRHLIHRAHGKDETTAMLTQELLLYMSMLIRTEPQLFSEMLRLRVSLVIQVMAGELQRLLHCSPDEATEALVNLCPYDMKNLLYHIISGKDFSMGAGPAGRFVVVSRHSAKVSKKSEIHGLRSAVTADALLAAEPEPTDESDEERSGQWLRRRRLDGALNRVPLGFYPRVYAYLDGTPGVYVAQRLIPHSLTQEMTAGETKFALQVEAVLTQILEPEYRQLMVEALMVLTLLPDHGAPLPDHVVEVERLVHHANDVFLEDQRRQQGDATLCCARTPKKTRPDGALECGGASYVCRHFYDSAPSGGYGTLTYLVRAAAQTLNCLPHDGEIDCNIC
ncbi:LOW QUALITY PROTEIN: probable phosphorylase b kinase regulatory subunit alpha [Pollicipes pollicipes]|uniref:LOW QUALITY PROTEIN: probable phosphorylase b kinase regulatory subunit alpha n=1 Tax=Pollicipes pollicipes TaxID=41117 RepID=UPI0018854AE2|nr:LOW QUALITY PROTEIN: probable phosphorylase b kinase regulatory subunit alpha [Pollicipes pollicipes]